MKVVINKCYGGFGLSPKAQSAYLARKGKTAFFYTEDRESGPVMHRDLVLCDTDEAEKAFVSYTSTLDFGKRIKSNVLFDTEGAYFSYRDVDRSDPDLAAVVEELGDKANGSYAELRVVEIPDDTNFEIYEYDGMESIHEVHQSWGEVHNVK